jgi:vanillate/4-hydroxybenzoate decarboxylase subunit D
MTRQRTTSPALTLQREPVAGLCPACASASLSRYPVNSEGGWFNTVKCQNCLHSVERERAPRLGPIQLISDTIKDAV